MDIIKINNNSYYIKGATNIGLIKDNNTNNVTLVDVGIDKDIARKLDKLLNQENLIVTDVLITHSNADHVGALANMKTRYKLNAYAKGIESTICQNPILEPSILYGGLPSKNMQNKFLMAKPAMVEDINNYKNEIINYVDLPGHFFDQIGFVTNDKVVYIGDALFSKEVINKYKIVFNLDIKAQLETLDRLIQLVEEDYQLLASHVILLNKEETLELIDLNKKAIKDICNYIQLKCSDLISFEILLQQICFEYNINLDLNQYLLIGCTIRNYLTYLMDLDVIEMIFKDNICYYKTK